MRDDVEGFHRRVADWRFFTTGWGGRGAMLQRDACELGGKGLLVAGQGRVKVGRRVLVFQSEGESTDEVVMGRELE